MLLIIKQQSHFRFRSGVALLLLSHDRYAILDLSKNLHGDEKMQRKKEIVTALILTALMAFIEMSALPMALFCNIEFKDIEPIYFALMLNFLLAFAICFLFRKFLIKE